MPNRSRPTLSETTAVDTVTALPARVDLILRPRWMIPVVPAGVVLENRDLVIHESRIVALCPREQTAQRYLASSTEDLPEHVLIPGLVNAHCHAAMALMRGIADDQPLQSWLETAIWPLESRWASTEMVRDGTLLACAEMLRAGITTFNDMYFFPEAAAEVVEQCGIRASLGILAFDVPSAYGHDADDYLNKGLAVRDALRDHPRLSFMLAPHAPYTVSDATFERVAMLAAQTNLGIHIHVHETQTEVDQSLQQYGERPIERLERLGILGPQTLAVHSVALNDADIAVLARHNTQVAHCPTANLKLASGIARTTALQGAGINIGLGTDGAAGNNRLDLLSEARLAGLLAKGASGDASALPAHTLIYMATLGGARALGLSERIGSLEPGKQADLCAIRFDGAATQPVFDPASHILYAAGREHVSDVWVDGQSVVKKKQLAQISEEEVSLKAKLWQNRFRG
ncbi:MAG: TRZ/ATZ family hydrolase [Rhodocyclaceae bacterium]|nr:TRZ/ATZ family hydrolase [Rhodocyclaceae bacterium]